MKNINYYYEEKIYIPINVQCLSKRAKRPEISCMRCEICKTVRDEQYDVLTIVVVCDGNG